MHHELNDFDKLCLQHMGKDRVKTQKPYQLFPSLVFLITPMLSSEELLLAPKININVTFS